MLTCSALVLEACPKGCLGVPSLTAALQKAVGWVLCLASSAQSLLVPGWEPRRGTLVLGQAVGRDISGIWQREELCRRGWGTSHTPVVCNLPAAALALCPEVQQGEVSGISPFRCCIESTWGFPIWFHSDNPALESRRPSCRHRETCRNQQQPCWNGCDTRSTCQSLPSSSPGKQEPAAEQKRAQSTKTPGRCCTAAQHGLL